MGNKINNKNIVKYLGAGILVTALTASASAMIYDECVDHTDGLCLFAKVINHSFKLSNGDEVTYGLIHQMEKMQEEYKDRGEEVLISYIPNYFDTMDMLISAEQLKLSDETYNIPEGYRLIVLDGVEYFIKKEPDDDEMTYGAIVTYYQDGKTNYYGKRRVLRIED